MQFRLPELGEGVLEGELVKWRVKAGDAVVEDQPLLDVMTDKATVEIPSPYRGKVKELHAKEGETIKVEQLLVSFEAVVGAAPQKSHGAAHAPAPAKAPAPAPAPAAAKPAAPAPKPAEAPRAAMTAAPAPVAPSSGRAKAAPSTRRIAREMGVDIETVNGSGPEGRIVREDLKRHLEMASLGHGARPSGRPAVGRELPAGGEMRVPFRGLRKKISEKMRLSKDKAAHFTYVEEADATALVRLRDQAKEIGATQGVKVTYLPFVMKAMVAALRQFPILNSELDEEKGEIVYKHYYNIGLSIQTEDGLTAPVVKGVEHKSILELAKDIQELVQKAREKRLAIDDFKGGTITLTNAGSIGGLFATPVINFPEVAILGFNKIFRKPVVRNVRGVEKIVIRDWTYFSISLDHRIVDGAVGAEFMKLFIRYIENPALLLMESF